MTTIFLKLLNMSIAASWLVLAVVLFRPLLKKAPKWISCLLWGIVALRLMVPVALESNFSLIPSAEVIPQDIATTQTPAIYSGIYEVNSAVNPLFTEYPAETESILASALPWVSTLWLAGMAALLISGAVSYWKLRRQVEASVLYKKNVYACDDVASPFILGIFFPKIYIPSGMSEEQLAYVLAHEKAHIKRRDHWWKPLGFFLLAVYWFNPLLWLAYILLCRDIERACDEKVIAGMDNDGRKGYSQTLVACSMHRRIIMACPVAFGEVGVKERVKGILHYKKPGFWIVLASVAVCIVTAVCFLTDPVSCQHNYENSVRRDATCTNRGVMEYTCSECGHLYTAGIALCDHCFDAPVVTQAPTCAREGQGYKTCADCGFTQTVALPKLAHTAGEPYFVKEPNCTEQGERSATCAHCGVVFLAEILETNGVHDLKETARQESTCAQAGESVHTCTRCAHSETVLLELAAHNYVDGMTYPSNCLQEGSQQKLCAVCGKEIWLTIPKPEEHIWVYYTYGVEQCSLCHDIRFTPSKNSSYSLLDGVTYQNQTQTPDTVLPSFRWDPKP